LEQKLIITIMHGQQHIKIVISVVSQPPYSPDLSPCDYFFFPKLNSTSNVVFWNCGQHPKGRDRPAEGTSTWRLPALLREMGATSPAVCGFPRELLWRE